MNQRYLATSLIIGKTIQRIAARRGGGSALPGLIIERLDPGFLSRSLSSLPKGVVVITGTNGKTTTTKITAQLLSSAGLRVFTNKSGSNFTRGIASAVLQEVDNDGTLPHDIAVLELDEAHAVHFVRQVKPAYVLCLNVMRDQLDRFGEIDHTAKLIETVAASATEHLILNADDTRISAIATSPLLQKEVEIGYFGTTPELARDMFVADDKLHNTDKAIFRPGRAVSKPDVQLSAVDKQNATFIIDKLPYRVEMKLTGAYNFLNAAGALALIRRIEPALTPKKLTDSLSVVEPAFGRGEKIIVNDVPLEIVLVKNPAGFRLALASLDPADCMHMIAINDQYADGRDMSWLWDVDFSQLRSGAVNVVSGVRAYDMALRLQYDNVTVRSVTTDLSAAVDEFITMPLTSGDTTLKMRRIYCTYTAMLNIRRRLSKVADVQSFV